jgi:hypothetical protein
VAVGAVYDGCSPCLTTSQYWLHFDSVHPRKPENQGETLESSIAWHVFDGTMRERGMSLSWWHARNLSYQKPDVLNIGYDEAK